MVLQKWRHKNGITVFAEKYGDLITAGHKVLNEGRVSWNNHRYAVVVQVLATQWNPCQTKTSQETETLYESTYIRRKTQKLFIRTIY